MWCRPESRAGRDWLLAVALLVAACGGDATDAEPSIAPGPGADTAAEAVQDLVEAIDAADFAEASRMAVPGQAALAALAEGATSGEVALALREGDEEIAANFWAGFAQGAGDFLSGDVTAAGDGTVTEGEIEFHTITINPANGETRTVLVRDVEGFRVDLFASFGPGLADKMTDPVARLLQSQTEDSSLVLSALQDIVPSLLVSASLPGTTADASQQILALIEVITRVG